MTRKITVHVRFNFFFFLRVLYPKVVDTTDVGSVDLKGQLPITWFERCKLETSSYFPSVGTVAWLHHYCR